MRMTKRRSRALAGVAALAAAALIPVTAQAKEPRLGTRAVINFIFASADSDNSGALDPGEVLALRMRGFDRADTDGNGTITAAEQAAAQQRNQRRAAQMTMAGEGQFERFDVDGDGNVTRAEFENGPTPFFALLDANEDGSIDRNELRRLTSIIDQVN